VNRDPVPRRRKKKKKVQRFLSEPGPGEGKLQKPGGEKGGVPFSTTMTRLLEGGERKSGKGSLKLRQKKGKVSAKKKKSTATKEKKKETLPLISA